MLKEKIEALTSEINNLTAATLDEIEAETLQLLRMVHFALWESDCYHNTLGRFDQYIYPYYEADLKAGRITEQQGFDLIEEFFLACNKDSDLYVGMQQGDNGQSIVLGGRDQEGNYRFNKVSEICLKASFMSVV